MLFQAGSLTVFLLFWQVPDIFGDTKTDEILRVVHLISNKFTELNQEVYLISDKLNQHANKFTELKQDHDTLLKLSRDKCTELKQDVDSLVDQDHCIKGQPHANGTKRITLWGNTTALCDTTTDGGGWIIIQRRTNGDVDFYRGWNEYRTGFGNLDTGFWLGNNAIHLLTEQGYNELRIELSYEGRRYYAHYSNFRVASEALNYRLTVGAYEGTAGDSLTYNNNMDFTTIDRDNDKSSLNCSEYRKGAWWYNDCSHSNLNGLWGVHGDKGMIWVHLTGFSNYVSFSEMKIRRG